MVDKIHFMGKGIFPFNKSIYFSIYRLKIYLFHFIDLAVYKSKYIICGKRLILKPFANGSCGLKVVLVVN